MGHPVENASAADFERSSSRDDREVPSVTFDEWVQQHLETARIAYEASEGRIDPWVVLVRPEGATCFRRLFTPEADETNRNFFARVKREARDMSASQVFVTMVSQGAHTHDDDLPTAADIRNREAEFDPIFEVSILWYAESPQATRYGMIPAHSGRAGDVLENTDEGHQGASPLFTDILR